VERGRRHKPLAERARGLLGQVRRWLPHRALLVVADRNYAVLELLLAWCTRHTLTVITRLRLDAALYAEAPARRPGQKGRRRLKGERVKKPTERLQDRRTRWQTVQLPWYGQPARRLQLASATAVWYDGGKPPVALRWVLVRDPKGRCEPLGLLSTDLNLEARQIVLYYMRRSRDGEHLPSGPLLTGHRRPAPMECLGRGPDDSEPLMPLFVSGLDPAASAGLAAALSAQRVGEKRRGRPLPMRWPTSCVGRCGSN
jgi:DDE superfamily endonuclease